MDFSGKRVLITGGNGFVGATLLARLLQRGAEVMATVREGADLSRLHGFEERIRLIRLDLREGERVRRELAAIRPDYLFNTVVNRDGSDLRASVELNGTALLDLLEGASWDGLEGFVHLGSSREYGATPGPFREIDLPDPHYTYGGIRAAGTMLLQGVARAMQLPVTILRPFYVYGPGEPMSRLVSSAISSIRSGKEIFLTAPGYTHDFVFVEDVAEACEFAAANQRPGEIFNIASGEKTTNEALVAKLGELMGRRPKVKVGAFEHRPWDRTDWQGCIDKARDQLGWHPSTTLKQGLRKTIDRIEGE